MPDLSGARNTHAAPAAAEFADFASWMLIHDGDSLVPFEVVCNGPRNAPHARTVLGFMAIHRRAMDPWAADETYGQYTARRRLTYSVAAPVGDHGERPFVDVGQRSEVGPAGITVHEYNYWTFCCPVCTSSSERGRDDRVNSDTFTEVAWRLTVGEQARELRPRDTCGRPRAVDVSPWAREVYAGVSARVRTVAASNACYSRNCDRCDGTAGPASPDPEAGGAGSPGLNPCGCPCHSGGRGKADARSRPGARRR